MFGVGRVKWRPVLCRKATVKSGDVCFVRERLCPVLSGVGKVP